MVHSKISAGFDFNGGGTLVPAQKKILSIIVVRRDLVLSNEWNKTDCEFLL